MLVGDANTLGGIMCSVHIETNGPLIWRQLYTAYVWGTQLEFG